MKFSVNAYSARNVSSPWWWLRWTGSFAKYSSVSCIQPMSHLRPKPRPPISIGRDTIGHAVDSSAIIWTSGWVRVHVPVQPAHELDRVVVLATAVRVRDPLARAPRVVEVEHRRDRVDPDAVGVVGVEPVRGARGQEAAHLVAAVVEDRAAPVGMESLARIGVLVQVRPVEVGEAVLVVGEVRRHPVEDHADARLVQLVDERHEVLGVAVAARRREVARRLVAPRAVERVLHDRQQLDVREAEPRDVLDERGGEIAVSEQPLGIVGRAPPRPEVDLVHRERRVEGVPGVASGHPVVVAPGVVELPDHRGSLAEAPRSTARAGRPCRRGSRRCAMRRGTCRACRGRCPARTPPRSRSRRPAQAGGWRDPTR